MEEKMEQIRELEEAIIDTSELNEVINEMIKTIKEITGNNQGKLIDNAIANLKIKVEQLENVKENIEYTNKMIKEEIKKLD